ncbi:DNA recombination protein RmuC [Peteryoungia ipomoeae]|uniref:DNA recombination protein RmuC homolog n=1 Tax=Peteryoungia ipomoeae TaxID=1210932 RepID=A0A4S8P7K0_9HYPH|nr:DNA recombination protein RmuC [Peteryoungia ipomoeae]THV23914.1 DNA recombination protein RmuC [Peteryoungia ipomoeae]
MNIQDIPSLTIGSVTFPSSIVASILAAIILLPFILLVLSAIGGARRRAAMMEEALRRDEAAELRLAELLKAQAEMQGRLATMAEVFGSRQAELNQSISQRLDGMTHRLGTTITEQTKSTHDNLRSLQERLAVIDAAQNNIQSLAKDVVGLQAILSNKQTRGAFGQSRMETIVADGLPMGAYEFQSTLSNGSRPDCTIRMPNASPPLVVDAKFPLEAWNAIRDTENPDHKKVAQQQFRRDMDVHVRDISEKYLITGETQDMAFLFVPSESIFAEIHENFEDIVQKAHKRRVVIVSPSLLMLSIQVIQAVLKDQRMREQAHLIQGEVVRLMEDLSRLDDRTRKLQSHFLAAQKDVEQILTSSDKITKRGQKIEAMEFQQASDDGSHRPVDHRNGTLKLRVVDED